MGPQWRLNASLRGYGRRNSVLDASKSRSASSDGTATTDEDSMVHFPRRATRRLFVDIIAGSSLQQSCAVAYGQDTHTITADERAVFQLDDETMTRCAEQYFRRRPWDTYVCAPTDYGDVYGRFGWQQVKTTIMPVRAEIVSCEVKQCPIKAGICQNHQRTAREVDVSLQDAVCNIVRCEWVGEEKLSCSKSIKYKVCVKGLEDVEGGKVEFAKNWGVGYEESRQVTVGCPDVWVGMKEKETVESTLLAFEGTMVVKITYRATIKGGFVVVYGDQSKNEYWCLPIDTVLNDCRLDGVKEVHEIVHVSYFSDWRLQLRDPLNDKVTRTVYGPELCARDE